MRDAPADRDPQRPCSKMAGTSADQCDQKPIKARERPGRQRVVGSPPGSSGSGPRTLRMAQSATMNDGIEARALATSPCSTYARLASPTLPLLFPPPPWWVSSIRTAPCHSPRSSAAPTLQIQHSRQA
jgi:hypothetical protein